MSPAELDLSTPAAHAALRQLAEQAARVGGDVARGYFRTELAVRLKADHSEVSNADEAAQAALVAAIRAQRSGDAFLTEETLPRAAMPTAAGNDVVCWVIDPIDGTRNFIRGIPIYACSVAAMFGGVPLVGAIYDPQRSVLYSGSQSEGLFVNGVPHAGPATSRPRGTSRPVVAIPSTVVGPLSEVAHDWLKLFICRNLGSTALHLAMVAIGELDAMLADNARLWDLAAGWVLVGAAGGAVTTPAGAPHFPLDIGLYVDAELPAIAKGAGVVLQTRAAR